MTPPLSKEADDQALHLVIDLQSREPERAPFRGTGLAALLCSAIALVS
jgi:hypothetical protein